MNNAMEATGLTKHYGNFLAVDHVSFEVKEGKIFDFLGPNGAGKTTTIRLLTGQTRPTSGSLTVSGTQKMSGGRMYKKIFFSSYAPHENSIREILRRQNSASRTFLTLFTGTSLITD